MKIRTLNYSLAESYYKGELTLQEVAREFCKHGWTNYVDVEFATAMCNVVFYEDKVDEYIEKME